MKPDDLIELTFNSIFKVSQTPDKVGISLDKSYNNKYQMNKNCYIYIILLL